MREERENRDDEREEGGEVEEDVGEGKSREAMYGKLVKRYKYMIVCVSV